MSTKENYLDYRLLDVEPTSLSAIEKRQFVKEIARKAPIRASQILEMSGQNCKLEDVGKNHLDALQRWIWPQRLVNPLTEDEIADERKTVLATYGNKIGDFIWNNLDKRGLVHCGPEAQQIGIDVALLVACLLQIRHPSLTWKTAQSSHPRVDKHPALTGFHRRELFVPTACPEVWCAWIDLEPSKSYIWNRLADIDQLVVVRGARDRLIMDK